MEERWQLYDEQGRAIAGLGASKQDVFGKGLLHGGAHVWIWRNVNDGVEVLLQKRSATKQTWPDVYDISAAGHIDLGEQPIAAAVRETAEEVGISSEPSRFIHAGVYREHMVAPNDAIENEFQWLYVLQMPQFAEFTQREAEVAALDWKSLFDFKTEVLGSDAPQDYVPHGRLYYETVIAAIERAANEG